MNEIESEILSGSWRYPKIKKIDDGGVPQLVVFVYGSGSQTLLWGPHVLHEQISLINNIYFKVVLRFKIVKIYSNFISRYFANFERLGWDFALRDIFMKKKVILSTITLSGLQVLPKYWLSGSWNSQSYRHNLRLKVGFFFNFWELSVGPQRTIKIRVTLFTQGVTGPRQN